MAVALHRERRNEERRGGGRSKQWGFGISMRASAPPRRRGRFCKATKLQLPSIPNQSFAEVERHSRRELPNPTHITRNTDWRNGLNQFSHVNDGSSGAHSVACIRSFRCQSIFWFVQLRAKPTPAFSTFPSLSLDESG